MAQLGAGDLERVVQFLGQATELEGGSPFEESFLSLLRELVPSSTATYADLDLAHRTLVDSTSSTSTLPGLAGPGIDVYFDSGCCPMENYRERSCDPSAARLTDFASASQLHELAIFTDYLRPWGVEHAIAIGLPAPAGRNRSVTLFREPGTRDFSERDCDILDIVRPHLVGRQELAMLRGRPVAVPVAGELTKREREILEMVAQGKTNAGIAEILWIAPSTVKKHLENVYKKLGVPSRAAAVAMTRLTASR